MSDHELDQYLNKLEKKNQIVVNYLRTLIKNTAKDVIEVYKPDGAIFYELKSHAVCFINISREKVVRLGLPHGALLPSNPLLREAPGDLRFVHVIGTINPAPEKIEEIVKQAAQSFQR